MPHNRKFQVPLTSSQLTSKHLSPEFCHSLLYSMHWQFPPSNTDTLLLKSLQKSLRYTDSFQSSRFFHKYFQRGLPMRACLKYSISINQVNKIFSHLFGSLIFLHFNILHSLSFACLIDTQRFELAKIRSVNVPIGRKFPLYSPLYEFPLFSDFTFLVVRFLNGLISTIDFPDFDRLNCIVSP